MLSDSDIRDVISRALKTLDIGATSYPKDWIGIIQTFLKTGRFWFDVNNMRPEVQTASVSAVLGLAALMSASTDHDVETAALQLRKAAAEASVVQV